VLGVQASSRIRTNFLLTITDHMAKIKDRLIFENKKIEAVVMRKTNKEQKLRVKESQANRAAEKSKRKRDHFKSLDDWQSSGAAGGRNDSALMDALEGKGPNKKRMSADKKYGFGGQKPRFKQNDKQSLNDSSSFNPRGNFPGGMKKRSALGAAKGGGGSGHRPGKRARDSKRTKA
jgi:rRNA-processing protein EBP2